eukprot:PhF_6_TR19278/c0_g1_i1/m.28342/K00507/SCD, desC; stearoyl-CoA desaturase (Delta-9 desaturase)
MDLKEIQGPSLRKGNWSINWVSTTILVFPPLAVLGAIMYGVPLVWNTFVLFVIFYALCGLSITAGYHRLFSHRAYNAHWTVQWIFAIFGAGAFQGSIKWWGRNHRIHHRYIDTDKDPYNARRGFFYSHLGWMLMKQDAENLGRADISDYNRWSVVQIQHKFYFPIAMFGGIILPTLIAGLGWGDWVGGYFYAALGKMIFVHHSTFFINSLAHSSLFGAEQSFADQNTSHDSFVCALLTMGEGYHNFHHEFPQDYRNGIRWFHYDPTKWLIRGMSALGLAYGLQRFSQTGIDDNRLRMKQKEHLRTLQNVERQINKLERADVPLPAWSMEHVQTLCSQGRKLMVIKGLVVDVEALVDLGETSTHKGKKVPWYTAHPGGKGILDSHVGKDVTEAFVDGYYKHSMAGHNLLHQIKVATLLK